MALLRSIIARRIKDQYKITTELLSCFSCWVLLAGVHFLFVPSHYLLVVMFSFTSFQSWFKPFLLSPDTLLATPRVRLLQTQSKRLSYGLQALRAAARRAQAWSSHLSRRRLQKDHTPPSQSHGVVAEHQQLLLRGASDPPPNTLTALNSSGGFDDDRCEEALIGTSVKRSTTADSGTPTSPSRLPAPPGTAGLAAGGLRVNIGSMPSRGVADQPSSTGQEFKAASQAAPASMLTHSATASPAHALDHSASSGGIGMGPSLPARGGDLSPITATKAKTKEGSLSVGNYRRTAAGRDGLPPLSGSSIGSRGPSLERTRSGSVPVPPTGLRALASASAQQDSLGLSPVGSSIRESVLPDEVRSALQQGPVHAKVSLPSSLAPGLRSKRGGTAAPDRGNQLWRDLLGIAPGSSTVRPYRMLPVFVPCALCGPHDVLAWWLWHFCGCSELRGCCGGTDLHQPVTMQTFATDPSVDGLPCSKTAHSCLRCVGAVLCCGGSRPQRKGSGAVYASAPEDGTGSAAVAIGTETTTIDDSAHASPAEVSFASAKSAAQSSNAGSDSTSGVDGPEGWRTPAAAPTYAFGCCGRMCARQWLADPHAFAASSVLWRGTLGISAAAPVGFCRPICRCSSDTPPDDADSDDVRAEESNSSTAGDADSRASAAVALFGHGPFSAAPLAAALGRRGFLSLLSGDPRRDAKAAVDKVILEEFSRALPSAAHKVLRAALRATAAAEVEAAACASATSDSSGDDGPTSGDESEGSGSSLMMQRAAQAKQQYGGSVIALVARVLCVDLDVAPQRAMRRQGSGSTDDSGSGSSKDGVGALESMMAAARAAQEGQPEVDGVYGVELATIPLSAAALARVEDASASTLGALWSLPKLVMHPIACAILREHCKACLCPELLDFVVAVRESKRRLVHAKAHIRAVWGELLAAQVASGIAPLHPYAQPSASAALVVWLGLGGARGAVPSAAVGVKPRSKRAARGGKAAARVEFMAGFGMFAPKYSPLVRPVKRRVARIAGGNRQVRAGTTTDSELLALSGSGGGSTSMYSATGLQDSTILSYSPAGNQEGMMPTPVSPGGASPAARPVAVTTALPQREAGDAAASRGNSTMSDGQLGGSVSSYASTTASALEHGQGTSEGVALVTVPVGSAGSDSKPSQRTMSRHSSATSQASVASNVLHRDLYAHALDGLHQGLDGVATLHFKQLYKQSAGTLANTLQLTRERQVARPGTGSGTASDTVSSAPSSTGEALHVTLPELDVAGIVGMVNNMHAVFLQSDSPLEINISNAMRTRLESDLHELFGLPAGTDPATRLGFVDPPPPKSAVAQRKLAAYTQAPSPSTLKDVAAAWNSFEGAAGAGSADSSAAVAAATALLQTTLDTITRMACVFDDAALEIMKLLDENVVSSLPQSDVGKRLALVRFRQRTTRRRRQSLVLPQHTNSYEGSGGSGLFRSPLRSAGKRSHKSSSSGSGTAGSATAGSGGSGIAPPPPPTPLV